MNKSLFPDNTAVSVKLDSLIRITEKRRLPERMSSRMVKCASVLENDGFIGWQMIVPTKGTAVFSVFGTQDFVGKDLEWISENTGKASKNGSGAFRAAGEESLSELYELYLPISNDCAADCSIGFGGRDPVRKEAFSKWPGFFSGQFSEWIGALRETGAMFRVVIGSASEAEQEACYKSTLRSYDIGSIPIHEYVGRPVRMRVLLRLPASPSVRLKSVIEESVQGVKIRRIGTLGTAEADAAWQTPLTGAPVLPDYAARILVSEPEIQDVTVGVQTYDEPMKKIPASHKSTKTPGAVEIGKATDTSGIRRRITIGETDLKRHYQIIGQTGTGKSTLLTNLILSAVTRGHGLTFFDPHGSTVDSVLRSLPQEYADRVRVVRIGDAENPVPLNIWDSDDPQKEERNISDLCELVSDIFDPHREGFVGPRYERWLSTFAKASIAFLGRRASLESIAVLSQSQENMRLLYDAIVGRYPELAETIKQEYIKDGSSDFQNCLNWYLCKFTRLTSVEQLRKTLGAGANALDFAHSIDTDTVTLIDLASPTIGTHAARIVGTLLMMKLWNAAMERKKRDMTHLVVVDEASLFQTNPMPRMLAESRKFGVSMVLCSQHAGGLTADIRDALEANSANLSAFRLSPKDASAAAIRFDDPSMQTRLARLDAFNAITTLSVDGRQTAPFTLEISKPKQQPDGEAIAAEIEQRSIEQLVLPYRDVRALTAAEILELLKNPEKLRDLQKREPEPAWLKDWKQRRERLQKAI